MCNELFIIFIVKSNHSKIIRKLKTQTIMAGQHQLEESRLRNSKTQQKMIKSLNSQSERLKSVSKRCRKQFL
jgi:hypothetical protein